MKQALTSGPAPRVRVVETKIAPNFYDWEMAVDCHFLGKVRDANGVLIEMWYFPKNNCFLGQWGPSPYDKDVVLLEQWDAPSLRPIVPQWGVIARGLFEGLAQAPQVFQPVWLELL